MWVEGIFFNSRRTRERPLVVRYDLCSDLQGNVPVDSLDSFRLEEEKWCVYTVSRGLRQGSLIQFLWQDEAGNAMGDWEYEIPSSTTEHVWSCFDPRTAEQFPRPGMWTVSMSVDGKALVDIPVKVAP